MGKKHEVKLIVVLIIISVLFQAFLTGALESGDSGRAEHTGIPLFVDNSANMAAVVLHRESKENLLKAIAPKMQVLFGLLFFCIIFVLLRFSWQRCVYDLRKRLISMILPHLHGSKYKRLHLSGGFIMQYSMRI